MSRLRASYQDYYLGQSHNELPDSFFKSLVFILVSTGVVSAFQIGRYSPIPISSLLDVWIISLGIYLFFRTTHYSFLSVTTLIVFLATCLAVGTLGTQSPLGDFFQAYRWVVYLIILGLTVGKQVGNWSRLVPLLWILLSLALFKAILTTILLGTGQRPGLFTENNFELALFSGLTVVVYGRLTRYRALLVVLLGLLVLLSGSRSGAVAYLIVVIYVLVSSKTTNPLVKYLSLFATPISLLAVFIIFRTRSIQSNGVIDRLRFFDVFLYEMQTANLATWIFGHPPITPLTTGGCDALSYYDQLFSSTGDGTCYSVIFHSFIMRVVFDAGLLGLFVSILLPYYFLYRSGVAHFQNIALTLISLSNGLSVSGFNNPYVFLPMTLAILTVSTEQRPGILPRPLDNIKIRSDPRSSHSRDIPFVPQRKRTQSEEI